MTCFFFVVIAWILRAASQCLAETCFEDRTFIVTTDDIRSGNLGEIEQYIIEQRRKADVATIFPNKATTKTPQIISTYPDLSTNSPLPTLTSSVSDSGTFSFMSTARSCLMDISNVTGKKEFSLRYNWKNGRNAWLIIAQSTSIDTQFTYLEAQVICGVVKGEIASMSSEAFDSTTIQQLMDIASITNNSKVWTSLEETGMVASSESCAINRTANAMLCLSPTKPFGSALSEHMTCKTTVKLQGCDDRNTGSYNFPCGDSKISQSFKPGLCNAECKQICSLSHDSTTSNESKFKDITCNYQNREVEIEYKSESKTDNEKAEVTYQYKVKWN